VWEVPLVFVPGAREVCRSDDSVMAFMNCGRLVLALFRLDSESEQRLEEMYRTAAGERAAVPRFLVAAATDNDGSAALVVLPEAGTGRADVGHAAAILLAGQNETFFTVVCLLQQAVLNRTRRFSRAANSTWPGSGLL